MAIPTSALIKLAGMGLSAEQAETVANMLREVEDATKAEVGAPIEARRAADRKRKQDERERVQIANGHVTSRDVTSCPVTSAASADKPAVQAETVFSSEEITPSSPPKGGSVSPKRAPKKPIGILCPEDLQPTESHYLKCEQRQVPRHVADETVRIMIDWSHSHANRDTAYKTDWLRALHRFLDGEIEKFKRAPPQGRPPPGQRLSGPTAATIARKQHRDSHDEPALNLEPVLRPFPARRGAEVAAPSECDGPASEGDRGRPFEGRVGTVFDLGGRRAHG